MTVTTQLKHSVGIAFTDNKDHATDCSFAVVSGQQENMLGSGRRGSWPTPDTTGFADVTNHHTICVIGEFDDAQASAIRELVDEHLDHYRECRLDASQVRDQELRLWIQTGCQIFEEEAEEVEEGIASVIANAIEAAAEAAPFTAANLKIGEEVGPSADDVLAAFEAEEATTDADDGLAELEAELEAEEAAELDDDDDPEEDDDDLEDHYED